MPSPDGWLIEPLVKEKRNLWIYGAGHVGTAIANTIDKLERFNIFCLDTSEERYPHDFPKNVERLIAVNPAELVKYAPGDTHHLILTYSHALDLEVCNQLLKQPFLSAGLIGSKTKWVRFKKRLGELGYKSEQIYRRSEETISKACLEFENDFNPISDMRASSKYRNLVAKNLLKKYFIELSKTEKNTNVLRVEI